MATKRAAIAADPLALAQDRFVRAYSNVPGPQEAIDPALAQLLLELGLKVLGQCLARRQLSGADVRAAASSPGLVTRLAVRRQVAAGLRDRHDFRPFGRRWNAQRMVDAILSAGATSTPEEIEAVMPHAVEAVEDVS